MNRHVYRPPKGRLTDFLASLGGLIAAALVFIAIPLTQKLSEMMGTPFAAPPEAVIEPPEDLDFDIEAPPEETEEEPEPEELVEESTELDLGLDLSDLTLGTGGGFVMKIPKFGSRGGDDPFGSAMDSPPTPVNRLPPTYPSSLLRRGIGGKVVVACSINAKGAITSSRIKKSSGHSALDKAALAAVNRWKFRPAVRDGRPIKATCNIPFNFEIKR